MNRSTEVMPVMRWEFSVSIYHIYRIYEQAPPIQHLICEYARKESEALDASRRDRRIYVRCSAKAAASAAGKNLYSCFLLRFRVNRFRIHIHVSYGCLFAKGWSPGRL